MTTAIWHDYAGTRELLGLVTAGEPAHKGDCFLGHGVLLG